LSFEKPDYDSFPALQMAFDALAQGGVMPAVLNAANEVAVENFLAGRIEFLDIANIVASTLVQADDGSELDLQAILAADEQARNIAMEIINAN
jgi:1-deoxy-D-xylulose-5-phosphate reductoisomerase